MEENLAQQLLTGLKMEQGRQQTENYFLEIRMVIILSFPGRLLIILRLLFC
jgi:hypothetical protein